MRDAASASRTMRADNVVEVLKTLLPPQDVAWLPVFGEDLAREFREGLEHSPDGWIDDDVAFTRPWGFDLSSITVPTFLWQGSEDLMVPFSHGQWLASRLPQAHARLLPNEGHLSVVVGAIDQILDDLLANQRGS